MKQFTEMKISMSDTVENMPSRREGVRWGVTLLNTCLLPKLVFERIYYTIILSITVKCQFFSMNHFFLSINFKMFTRFTKRSSVA